MASFLKQFWRISGIFCSLPLYDPRDKWTIKYQTFTIFFSRLNNDAADLQDKQLIEIK